MISDMKKFYLNIIFLIPFLTAIHYEPVSSGVYDWKTPSKNVSKNISASVLFEGSAHEMEWLQMNANALAKSDKPIKIEIPKNEEHLYIIRKGTIDVTLNNSSYSLAKGSILVLFPGEKLSIQNKQSNSCEYFVMKYRTQLPIDKEKAGSSFVKDWNKIEFNPNDHGGVRSFFERPTAMLKRLEMHVTTLNAGSNSHAPHKHPAKEIIVMMEGNSEMQIGEKFFKGKEGSVYFMESNVLHGLKNTGTTPCTYFAIQFE
jgi:(S)-ureidoglycine aminohydrolase